jgi:hypothetical protein
MVQPLPSSLRIPSGNCSSQVPDNLGEEESPKVPFSLAAAAAGGDVAMAAQVVAIVVSGMP